MTSILVDLTTVALVVLNVFVADAVGSPQAPVAAVQSRDASCTEWHDCRQMALAAAERGDYETFHDLAWRAVQTGPRRDPALMYLLARAQSLSGRPHDALVMLERLAEMGVPSDAVSNSDFARVRQLPEWPELAARLERFDNAGAPPGGSPASTPVSPAPGSSAAAPGSRGPGYAAAPAEASARFSTDRFAVAGLAYDAVSHRFLIGDRVGHKLIVVNEGSSHAVDLVRSDSAGFRDISALEIDGRRGDLWVASAPGADGAGTLHRLQLVSGRPLKAIAVAADAAAVNLVDLAVTSAGTVLVLDSAGRRVLVLHAGGTSFERAIAIDGQEPTSLTVGDDEGVAYVAYRDGVSRIDLRARTARRVAAPSGVTLGGLERIRWYRHALIAVARGEDGGRRVVRLELNTSGTAVTRATALVVSIPVQTFATVSGDELIYVVTGPGTAGADADRQADNTSSGSEEFAVYRVRLR